MRERRRPLRLLVGALSALLVAAGLLVVATGTAAAATALAPNAPALGPNVYVFDPTMPQADIQATVDAVAAEQVGNQFGTDRYSLYFKPGTYGSAASPLTFQVGYYTEVAGLGATPGDVQINGSVDVYNQCETPDNCIALNNFWRSLSNLTINVAGGTGCRADTEFWAVSQAAPMRRVDVNGGFSLMDYCTAGPQYASGGFVADSRFRGGPLVSGSQQQFMTRNSDLDTWSNGVWNQVFAGSPGAPATSFGVPGGPGPYTTLPTTPVVAEKPYLTASGSSYSVHVPAVKRGSSGPSWTGAASAERVLPLSSFLVATPKTSIVAINAALALGKNLLLSPGVYRYALPITVIRPGTVVLAQGMATIVPTSGRPAVSVLNVPGVRLAGFTVDAGPVSSPQLVQVGLKLPVPIGSRTDPIVVSDVFFRVGGAEPGKAATSLEVNASGTVLDHVWAWRADHGTGVGWTANTADTGVVVNGDDVTALGLFVEHYQKTQTLWRGERGTVVMFQNELPYDPPNQAAWQEPSGPGYPAFEVAPGVKAFAGYGMGSYSFFNQGQPIVEKMSFRVPRTPGVKLTSLLTVFLNGSGSITHVVNDVGAAATSANGGQANNVVSYP